MNRSRMQGEIQFLSIVRRTPIVNDSLKSDHRSILYPCANAEQCPGLTPTLNPKLALKRVAECYWERSRDVSHHRSTQNSADIDEHLLPFLLEHTALRRHELYHDYARDTALELHTNAHCTVGAILQVNPSREVRQVLLSKIILNRKFQENSVTGDNIHISPGYLLATVNKANVTRVFELFSATYPASVSSLHLAIPLEILTDAQWGWQL